MIFEFRPVLEMFFGTIRSTSISGEDGPKLLTSLCTMTERDSERGKGRIVFIDNAFESFENGSQRTELRLQLADGSWCSFEFLDRLQEGGGGLYAESYHCKYTRNGFRHCSYDISVPDAYFIRSTEVHKETVSRKRADGSSEPNFARRGTRRDRLARAVPVSASKLPLQHDKHSGSQSTYRFQRVLSM